MPLKNQYLKKTTKNISTKENNFQNSESLSNQNFTVHFVL